MRINDLGIKTSQINQAQLNKLKSNNNKNNFSDIFNQTLKQGELKFSNHAVSRMNERGITLNEEQKTRLAEAVNKAQLKGANECLVMVDNNAFVVSVKNNTVITAVDEQSMRGNVFTNIDSAVLSF